MSGFSELKDAVNKGKQKKNAFIQESYELINSVLENLNKEVFEGKGKYGSSKVDGLWSLTFESSGGNYRLRLEYSGSEEAQPNLKFTLFGQTKPNGLYYSKANRHLSGIKEITQENIEATITELIRPVVG
jgi:hypothetical protein